MSELSGLQQHAAQIRASGTLGKPGALTRLFDYLLERSLAGEAPKELEIAYKVFGKDSRFDVSQDAVVRVYMHKLRRRLDDYYAGAGSAATARIVIPKGEYRLTLESTGETESAAVVPESKVQAHRPRWIVLAVAIVAGIALGSIATYSMTRPPAHDVQLAALRSSPLWAPLLNDDLPITIVAGDYYLMGEADDSGQIRRLVREFFVNSTNDFLHQVEVSPKVMERYRNLNFTYLPTSTAFALRDIAPVLGTRKPVRVVLMSELNGSMLASSHIVYVGFISGLGILTDPALSASRIGIGETYDELVDQQANAVYRSTAGDAHEQRFVDYGLVSAFPGPGRNRVLIIAGTRDTAVTQMANVLTEPTSLDELGAHADSAAPFEALFEIYGVAGTSMNSKLLFVSPLDAKRIWIME